LRRDSYVRAIRWPYPFPPAPCAEERSCKMERNDALQSAAVAPESLMLHRAGRLLRKLDQAEQERRDHRPIRQLSYIPPGLRADRLSFPTPGRDSNARNRIADPNRLPFETARSLHHSASLPKSRRQDRP